jgi:hypothetical protein
LVAGTALTGAVRGWRREILTAAILLATLLFVHTGGAYVLANRFTRGTGSLAEPGSTTTYAATASCVGNLPATLSTLTFCCLTCSAYRVGRFVLPMPRDYSARLLRATTPSDYSERCAGMLLGVVNGAVMAYYLSVNVLRGRVLTLATPGPVAASAYVPMVIGVGLLGMLVVYFIAHQANQHALHTPGDTGMDRFEE